MHSTTWRSLEKIKVKNARHKRSHFIGLHLHEISRTGKFMEKDSRLVVIRTWGRSEWEWVLAHMEFPWRWWKGAGVIGGGCYATTRICQCHWTVHFKWISANFYVFLTTKKKRFAPSYRIIGPSPEFHISPGKTTRGCYKELSLFQKTGGSCRDQVVRLETDSTTPHT